MRPISKLKRGFTLVELMIVVAIVGVLAALAIYGVRKYIANSKTAEARNGVGQMSKDASTAYAREAMASAILAAGSSTDVLNRLCLSAGNKVPTASANIAGKKYQSSPTEWNGDDATAGWRCVKFSMSDPQYYQYDYQATGTEGAFSAIAQGDLNGDSTLSTFRMNGEVKTEGGIKEVFVSPSLHEELPEE